MSTSAFNAGEGGRGAGTHEEAPVSHQQGQLCENDWYQTKEHKKPIYISASYLLKVRTKGRKDRETWKKWGKFGVFFSKPEAGNGKTVRIHHFFGGRRNEKRAKKFGQKTGTSRLLILKNQF